MRHRDRHLPVTIAHAKGVREAEMGESLLEQARSLHARALGILERAEAAGQLETALKAIREVRGILELLAKLSGQLEERGGTPQRIEVVYIDKAVMVSQAQASQLGVSQVKDLPALPLPESVERATRSPRE